LHGVAWILLEYLEIPKIPPDSSVSSGIPRTPRNSLQLLGIQESSKMFKKSQVFFGIPWNPQKTLEPGIPPNSCGILQRAPKISGILSDLFFKPQNSPEFSS
jgi:hypothetical protein